MSVTSNALRELHYLHQKISRLREQIDRGPRLVEAKQKYLAQQAELLEKARADLKTIKVHAHQKETERKALDGRVNQLQLQINTAKSNKEYSTLVSEKEAAVKARQAVEDQILEFLLREEEKTKEIQLAEKEHERAARELSDLERKTQEAGSDLAASLADAESRLLGAETSLPPNMQDAYRRLLRSRGSDSLAQVESGTCTGCYTAITSQMQNQLMLHELVLCKSCGRILYQDEKAKAVKVE